MVSIDNKVKFRKETKDCTKHDFPQNFNKILIRAHPKAMINHNHTNKILMKIKIPLAEGTSRKWIRS